MADGPAQPGEALVVITNADIYIKESAITQQLRDTGIEFNRVIKKRGSQRAFVFFQTADNLDQAAALIRMLKAPISQQLYICDVVSHGSVPTLPATVIGADVKTVKGLLNFSQLNDNPEDETVPNKSMTLPFDEHSLSAATDQPQQPINFLPPKRLIARSSAHIVQVVAPYYSDNSEDELQTKSKLIRNAVKGQMAKMYKNHRNTAVIPLWAKRNECVIHLRQPVPVYSPPLLTEYRSKVEFTIGWTESILDSPCGSVRARSDASDGAHSPITIAVGPCVRQGKRVTIFSSAHLHEACIFPPVTTKLSSTLETVLSEAHASGHLSEDDLSLFTTLAIRCTGSTSVVRFDVTQLLVGVFLRIELPDATPPDDFQHPESDPNQLSSSYVAQEVTSDYSIALQKAWPLILKFHDHVHDTLKSRYHIVFYVKATAVQKGTPHRDRYYPVTSTPMETSPSRFYITQTLYNLNFRIGPETFFQSNLAAFTMLLDYISDIVVTILESSHMSSHKDETSSSLLTVELLDICCGSGVIGQCLAQVVLKKMINVQNLHVNIKGLDCSQNAIWNAEFNASENFKDNPNISALYICRKAEQTPEYFSGSAKIGILDPPRTGVFQSVLTAIRHSTLEYLIYISCNPKTMSQNIIDLSIVSTDSDLSKRTAPFYVEYLVGFNMFPGCEHVETVAILHRCPDLEGTPPKKISTSVSADEQA
ncbi:SAM-dependent methyltransferase [Giardia duodenalis]|uniref:SAM-dependent methyltransferase n=1 Tax=Giardia intestinalis TaxID=5741 RepID=V6TMA1_GIAIN|nr:SAM-dependent methyltransferase [Giardia intestinalis]